ncbi:MAG: right-handed parallel beta-helix repeat-containing protein [Phycisphaerales bacterium]
MRSIAVLSLALVATTSALAAPTVIFVDANAPSGGNGSSWLNAYNDLQLALAAAPSGAQVWVAQGTYKPKAPANATATFTVPGGVNLYGGFRGDESDIAQRTNPLGHPTALDGSGSIYHLITLNATTPVVIDGFYLVDANASVPPTNGDGAGVFATNANATLRNLVFQNCDATRFGGAIAAKGSSTLTIDACTFTGCDTAWATSAGGAVYAETAPIITNCEFTNNTAGRGAALALVTTSTNIMTVADSRVEGNAGLYAGAVYLDTPPGSFTFFEGCDFIDNTADDGTGLGDGAAIYFAGSGQHTVLTSRFLDNDAQADGGAIYIELDNDTDRVTVENSFLVANQAYGSGGAIKDEGAGDLSIINSTITKNVSNLAPGRGVYDEDGDLVIANSILWGNAAAGAGQRTNNLHVFLAVNASIYHSLIGGWDNFVSAPSTSDADPAFEDLDGPDNTLGTDDDNARLTPGSPAIDAGHGLFPSGSYTLDIHAQPRFLDDTGTPDTGVSSGPDPIVDIGAAEFQGTTPSACLADLDNNAVLNLDDISAFANAFIGGDLLADLDDNAVLNLDDIATFASAFLAGCP